MTFNSHRKLGALLGALFSLENIAQLTQISILNMETGTKYSNNPISKRKHAFFWPLYSFNHGDNCDKRNTCGYSVNEILL